MAATAAMSVLVLVVGEFAPPTVVASPLIRLILLSAGGAVAYFVVLFGIGSPVVSEGLEVIGWIVGRHKAER